MREIILVLSVQVSGGMSDERIAEWADVLRHDLEKVCMGHEEEADLFDVRRVTVTVIPQPA